MRGISVLGITLFVVNFAQVDSTGSGHRYNDAPESRAMHQRTTQPPTPVALKPFYGNISQGFADMSPIGFVINLATRR